MSTIRKIIHIDMDAFYASVEQLDNANLRGRPVIVGGNPQHRGVVAACSYEARRFGVHSAMPCSTAAKQCPQAIFTRPRMWRYQQISQKIMAIFLDVTALVEPLSLDEAFLDVTLNRLNNPSATRLAEIIRQRIYSTTGLTASAGISFNKFLAKIASDMDKPNGRSVILPQQALSFLDDLPVGKFFGVGKVTESKMQGIGITHGRHLRRFTREDLMHHFGKNGIFYYNIVRGIDDRPVRPNRVRKSIGSETTLQKDTRDTKEIAQLLSTIAWKLADILIQKDCSGSTITLKVRYNDFTTITRSITLHTAICSATDILLQATKLQQATAIGHRPVRLLGITISKLISNKEKKPVQLPLPFD